MRLIRWAECATVHVCEWVCVCVWHVYPVVCSLERTLTCPTRPGDVVSRFALQFQASISAFFYDKLHLATTDANASTITTPHPLHHVDCHTTTLSLKGFRFRQESGWGLALQCVCVWAYEHALPLLLLLLLLLFQLVYGRSKASSNYCPHTTRANASPSVEMLSKWLK